MNLLKKICIKLYYRYGGALLSKTSCHLSADLTTKKNLFIYFDYEREFGGYETNISDQDIDQILNLLNEYKLTTTWFTVGKIFDVYPKSIHAITSNGHEIGSHTNGHIAPFKNSIRTMKKDFELFDRASQNIAMVRGFHSPNGMWSLSMFRYLRKYDYDYDVYRITPRNVARPYMVSTRNRKDILRLQTLGDDWPLFVKKPNALEVFNYLKGLSDKLNDGDLAGIGFHPWVLYSKAEIFEGFKKFLDYISRNDDFNIHPALYYAEGIMKQQNITD